MAQTSEDQLSNSEKDFTCLQDVLCAFNNSINEEQAWAVCYQCAQFLKQNSSKGKYRDIYYYGTVAIKLGKEGEIRIDMTTNQGSGKGPPRRRSSFSMSKEFKTIVTQIDAIQALGSAIYKALDFGLSESEEPHLGPDLEELIEFMTHPTDDDEGIDVERDSDDSQGRDPCIFQDIIDKCMRHLSSNQNAGQHYKAVCRALVTESRELKTFLDRISSEQEFLARSSGVCENPDGLDDLERADWARLWVQIMGELRHGVRLKKVDHAHISPMEYELTPFEILLEDIRLGRFKLHRIMLNGDIPPPVKRDAHAVILDFIRSRPPLKSVKKRVLSSPPKRVMDPRELLMHDICQHAAKLKPVRQGRLVVGAKKPCLNSDQSSDEDSPEHVRKVIKPVAAFEVSTDDSDDSYLSDTLDDEGRYHVKAPVLSPLTPVTPDGGSWKRAVAKDLVMQPSCQSLARRHSISVCNRQMAKKHKWQNPIQCLSLTLEEVTHIRMVLTKAEHESLITDTELYNAISKAKVCFTCKKTKFSLFGLFGQSGTKCKFCQRTVCNYCLRKMNVPTEHFDKIPVYSLSPVPISPEVLEALKVYESTGSVPQSPTSTRRDNPEEAPGNPAPPGSHAPPDDGRLAVKRSTLQRSHTIGVGVTSRQLPNKALLKGPQMSICCDCKTMIMEIIRASRTTATLVNKPRETTAHEAPVVSLRPRMSDNRPRPRSMMNSLALSLNFPKTESDL